MWVRGERLKIDRDIYKYIEFEMRHYNEYKKEIKNIREEILEGSPEPPDGMPNSNGTGNPTENKAVKLSMSVAIASMERVINAIDNALKRLTDRHRRIFEMAYVKGRKDRYSMSDELFISYRTFAYAKNELVLAVGQELGVIKNF